MPNLGQVKPQLISQPQLVSISRGDDEDEQAYQERCRDTADAYARIAEVLRMAAVSGSCPPEDGLLLPAWHVLGS